MFDGDNERTIGHEMFMDAGLWAGWSRVWVPSGIGNFSLHHRVQTGSVSHPASYPMRIRGSFRGLKRPGREADNSI